MIVAFVAYPWQKRKDRELKIDDERRAVQLKVIAAGAKIRRRMMDRAGVSHSALPDLTAESADFDESISALAIYCDDKVVGCAQVYHKKVRSYLAALRKEKSARPEIPEGRKRAQRSIEYQELINKRHLAYREMRRAEETYLQLITHPVNLDKVELPQLDFAEE